MKMSHNEVAMNEPTTEGRKRRTFGTSSTSLLGEHEVLPRMFSSLQLLFKS